jgi:hypothetical protein
MSDIESYRRPHGRPGAVRFSAAAIGATAVGAIAIGAIAIGALAVGRLAVGRLAVKNARFGKVEIDDLTVRRLRVLDATPASNKR